MIAACVESKVSTHSLCIEERDEVLMIANPLLRFVQFYTDDVDDDVSMTALRLLTKDLLILFTCVNEGMINILGKKKSSHRSNFSHFILSITDPSFRFIYRTLFRNVTFRRNDRFEDLQDFL